jgi:hypothetical protein
MHGATEVVQANSSRFGCYLRQGTKPPHNRKETNKKPTRKHDRNILLSQQSQHLITTGERRTFDFIFLGRRRREICGTKMCNIDLGMEDGLPPCLFRRLQIHPKSHQSMSRRLEPAGADRSLSSAERILSTSKFCHASIAPLFSVTK